MKSMFAALAVVLTVSAAVPSRAQIQIPSAWDQRDLAAGLFAQLKAQVPATPTPRAAAPVAAPAAQPLVLAGLPVGSDRIDLRTDFAPTVSLTLKLNDDKTRVGVEAYICPNNIASNDDNNDCQSITYVLRGLAYDKSTKEIRLGDALIGRDRGAWHGYLRLEKGYELQSKTVTRRADQGFDHYSYRALEVSLVETKR